MTSADLKSPSMDGFQALAGPVRTFTAHPPTLSTRFRALTRVNAWSGAHAAAEARAIASVSAILGAGHLEGGPPRGSLAATPTPPDPPLTLSLSTTLPLSPKIGSEVN